MAHILEVERQRGTVFIVRWRDRGFKQKTFTNKRDAERFALKVENELADGASTDLLVRNQKTVRDVVEASLAASAPELKPRTIASYRAIYDNRVLPRFGSRRASSVTRADVQAWVAVLDSEGLSPATIHHHYIALRKAMKHAQDDRVIAQNPCNGVKLPKSKTASDFAPVFLDVDQVEDLASRLDAAYPYGSLVRFAAWTGLRAGEIAGLRVKDVDLPSGNVHVRQTKQRIAGEWVTGTPKSARSTRTVPILNRALRAELRLYILAHPHSGHPDAPFWPGRSVGSHELDWDGVLDVGSFRRNYMRPALRALGMEEMRFHDLRHTFASIVLDAGYAPRKVSHWMGHANLNTTDMIYGHMYPSDNEHEMARMDAYLRRDDLIPPERTASSVP